MSPQGKPGNRGLRSREFQMALVVVPSTTPGKRDFLGLCLLRVTCTKFTLGRFLAIPEPQEAYLSLERLWSQQ